MEDVKIKLAGLWFFFTIAWLVTMTLLFFAPGVIDEIRAGGLLGEAITGEFLLGAAICLLIPLVMAFMSLTLKYSINRWANIILGIIITAIALISTIEGLAYLSAYAILMDIFIVVFPALIVWHAWKWSKQET